jgi:hypothetical protein
LEVLNGLHASQILQHFDAVVVSVRNDREPIRSRSVSVDEELAGRRLLEIE